MCKLRRSSHPCPQLPSFPVPWSGRGHPHQLPPTRMLCLWQRWQIGEWTSLLWLLYSMIPKWVAENGGHIFSPRSEGQNFKVSHWVEIKALTLGWNWVCIPVCRMPVPAPGSASIPHLRASFLQHSKWASFRCPLPGPLCRGSPSASVSWWQYCTGVDNSTWFHVGFCCLRKRYQILDIRSFSWSGSPFSLYYRGTTIYCIHFFDLASDGGMT